MSIDTMTDFKSVMISPLGLGPLGRVGVLFLLGGRVPGQIPSRTGLRGIWIL